MTSTTTVRLSDLSTVDHPAPRLRVSRCFGCGLAFTWHGSAAQGDPGCVQCGGSLGTTTRRLRTTWHLLDGAALDWARRLPGGIAHQADWHRRAAERYQDQAARYDAITAERGDETGERATWAGNCRAAADRETGKADKLARRLVKLGGPVEAAR